MAVKIEDPSIKLADNGFIISYRECTKDESGKNTYDGYSSSYKELVFPFDQQKVALDKFIELGKAAGKLSATSNSANEESPEGEE